MEQKTRQFQKAHVIRFLIWTFVLSYLLQFGTGWVSKHVHASIGQLFAVLVMATPTLGVLLSGAKHAFKEMGWNPHFRKNWKWFLLAWFAPALLTAAGAVLYFLVFPGHFDASGGVLVAIAGPEASAQLQAAGISFPLYILITVISALTYGPLINTFVALGEEIGWRGFLYPQLEMRFGQRAGWILGGLIWGAFHWPLIALIGYEYGASAMNEVGYAGFPVSGMLLFCVVTVGWGTLHAWLYKKSESIWIPSLFHGAINAVASAPLLLCLTNTGSARLLGPAPVGILSALPFLIWAVWLLAKRR